ncbi:MAG: hypothetical protein SOU82_04490, partial [Alloprevotella sp.]|nr:hypothetical protein [Alloprevotella sp.]
MRKFTKFFMLLFAFVGATVGYAQSIAESPTPISGLTSGYYVIKNVNPGNKPANNNNYIYCENTENGALKLTATAPSEGVTNPATIDKYLWYVDVKPTGAGENVTVTISSVFQTGYWPVAQTGDKSLVVTNNPQVFDLKTTNQTLNGNTSAMTVDGNTCLIGNTTSYNDRLGNPQTYSYFHVNVGNNIGSWHDANPQSLLYAQFYAATGIAKKLTLNCTDSKLNNTFTKVATFVSYSPLSPADLLDFYTIQSVKKGSGETVNKITESGTYTVNCTSHFPFELMTITDGAFANANFYTMLNDNNSRDIVYSTDQNIRAVSGIKEFNKESLWAFELVTGTEANFRIYNLAAGASKCIYKDGTNTGTVAMGNPTSASSTKEFVLYINGSGYGFRIPGTTTACLNPTGNKANEGDNTSLGVWNDNNSPNNNGSRFFFTSVDNMVPAEANVNIGEPDDHYKTEDGYAAISNENATILNYLQLYNFSKSFSALNSALNGIAETPGFDINKPFNMGLDGSKIYQIISYKDGQVVYADPYKNSEDGVYDRGRNLLTGSVSEDPTAMTAMSAMIITESGANYYIQHANSGYWLCNVNEGSFHGTPDLPFYQASSAPYVIKPANYKSNVFALKTSTGVNKWLACGGENNTLSVLTEDPNTADGGYGNPAGFWLIKEIKSIPVKIGAAKWSTLCLPVAVTVPNDASLKVYTVSGVDNVTGVMTLNVVEPGTVVAKNTGLLLASTSENASDTYNFAVSTDAGTSYEGNNILMGTTARRIGFNTAGATDPTDPAITIPHYALAQKDGVVAFYPSILNILPANKAYIKKSDIASSGSANRALYMTGNTTGVDNTLIQNGETEEYYDLNGRRVLY